MYERSAKQEVYGAIAWQIDGMIFRNFKMHDKPTPDDLEKLRQEALKIDRDFTITDSEEKLNACEKRLLEIKDYVVAEISRQEA
jgi:hypothetical protein